MPKRIPDNVKTKAMELFLEGRPARDIAETVSDEFEVIVKTSPIYAWANIAQPAQSISGILIV